MSGTILLARHASHDEVGHVLSGRSEIGLNARGRGEVALLGERLARTRLAAVHSSPRRRALETARAAGADVTVETVDALDEIDFGDWMGMRFDTLDTDPRWHRWNSARGSAPTPGGENMAAATHRAVRHIEEIDAEGAPVLCVSHCDIIRGVVAHYLGLDPDRMLGFDVDPASLTTLEIGAAGGRVIALNERVA